MNLKELKDIINLMKEHSLSEIEIEKDGFKIRLKKSNGVSVSQEEIMPLTKPSFVQETRREVPPPSEKVPAANEAIIRSPMVGTFYAAPAPDQPPYVDAGSIIKTDDVLCIVEAMKLMNEIKSEINGKIVEILVENGTAVEFDQPLFRVAL